MVEQPPITTGQVSEYYDDLDEHGQDRNFPPSLIQEFVYEPNILSEELVRFQRFIHKNHQSIDNAINTTVNTIFYVERKTISFFQWCRKDLPSLVWPTMEVTAFATAGYYANRLQPLKMRLAAPIILATMAGFLVYPSWGRKLAENTEKHIIRPSPTLTSWEAKLTDRYWGFVNGIVGVWNYSDHQIYRAKASLWSARQKIVSFFKPGRLYPPPSNDDQPK